MQNYTYFEQISKTIFKSAFLGLFFKFYSTLPPPLKQKVLPPPAGKIRIPPLPAHFLPPSCRPPPCPSMEGLHGGSAAAALTAAVRLHCAAAHTPRPPHTPQQPRMPN